MSSTSQNCVALQRHPFKMSRLIIESEVLDAIGVKFIINHN